MTIFTSYFANIARILDSGFEDIDLVNISRYPPPWYPARRGVRSMRILAPSEELQTEYTAKKRTNHPMKWDEYCRRYRQETLKPLDNYARMLYYDLLMGSKDTFLLCHEPPYEHCHRTEVAAWFESHMPNICIEEWRYRG